MPAYPVETCVGPPCAPLLHACMQERLLKLWHGDTHLIADDHTAWKKNAPTFAMVHERLRTFFNMDIKATRFNVG